MKNNSLYKALFGVLLVAGVMTSCSGEDEWNNGVSYPKNDGLSLTISPSVFGLDNAETRSTTETQAEAQSAKNYEESTIHTLDVYLIDADNNVFLAKRIEGGESGIKNDGTQEYLVAEKCNEVGVNDNTNYKVYVSANSNLTNDQVTAMKGKTINYLKALNTEDQNIYRRYATAQEITEWTDNQDESPKDYQIPFISEKKFLMDYVTTWNSGTAPKKVITMTKSSGLKRAAAKIVFNMEFSTTFKRILYGQDVKTADTEAYSDEESTSRYIITGEPRVRYVNFAFNTTDFTDGTYDQEIGKEVKTGSLIFMTDKEKGTDAGGRENIYGHTTYSFANTWTAVTRVDDAPYIMVSLPFQQQERDNTNAEWVNKGNVQYNYYRIPICQEDVLELKRNNLYMVKAVINSFGSSSPMDEDQEVDLYYEILDWQNQDPVKMEAKLFNYLKVIPQTVYIYGNGTLTTDIQYFINSNSSLANITIPAANITYKNANGTATQVNESGNTTTAVDNGNGTITITSKSLANHAVKDFTFTVQLSNDNTKTAVVTVKHIPTDNIQNIAGAWSSKTDGATVTGATTYRNVEYNNIPAGWDNDTAHPYLTTFDFRTTAANNYIAHTGYWQRGNTSNYSLTEAVGYTYHSGTIYVRTSYQRYTLNTSTWDWVDWDKDTRRNVRLQANHFSSKFLNGSTIRIANTNTGTATIGNTDAASNSQNNYHMYVIQIGSTSTDYVLGNPTVNPVTHLSQDHVVAPAFMLGSQLGTVSGLNNGLVAAAHCSEYVEVTKKTVNGTPMRKIYDDWRLPTKEEINVIVKYQDENIGNKVIDQVLKGNLYWTLDGTTAFVPTYQITNTAARCIRTMTADDLKFLNDQMSVEELQDYMETY